MSLRPLALAALLAAAAPAAAAPPAAPTLSRADFNRLAVLEGLPLFWASDTDRPGQLDPAELAPVGANVNLGAWVARGAFTPAFHAGYARLAERRRREAVARELDAGRPTLVVTDFTAAPPAERRVIAALAEAAKLVDQLHLRQRGAEALARQLAPGDTASAALFARNQGPWCQAPGTDADPFCHALPTFAPRRDASYPPDVEPTEAWCQSLQGLPNAAGLTDPFTVVRSDHAGLVPIPYDQPYGDLMGKVATQLDAAAKALPKDEDAFRAYLQAAAKGFRTNQWWEADEAWSRMSARNSRWYLRVGPDETYWDACGLKAGFHMSLARVDQEALAWQDKLAALRGDMETRIARVIGAPYQAREVGFQLPEFIHVVLNAGDSRSPLGATVGQSLPNFGPVAEQSRGRTVVMANLYTDPDSLDLAERKARALLAPATLAHYTRDPAASNLDVVLHEATHNLGPNGAYKVDGKAPDAIFGGPTAAILEELKAQTGALFYPPLLRERDLVTDEQVRQAYVASLMWAFGQIAQGMTTASGYPRTYSQVAAVQVGELMRAGALRLEDGRFALAFDRLPAAVDALMAQVGGVMARGDAPAAQALLARNTSPEALQAIHAPAITAEIQRHPKATFLYSVRW